MIKFTKKKKKTSAKENGMQPQTQHGETITTESGLVIPAPVVYKRKRHLELLPHLVIIVALLFVFVPVYIMLSTSIMSRVESQSSKFHWFPENPTLESYKQLLTAKSDTTFWQSFINTMWIYVPSIAIGVFMSAGSAYAFAKIDFKLSKPMFGILLATMTLPNSLNQIVSYLMYAQIRWVGTPLPLMVPRMMGTIGIVFFLRQFFMGVPDDIMGAAYLDGLNEATIFVHIMVPLAMPSMLAQFLLTFIGAYNDYMGPLIYLLGYPEYTPLALYIVNVNAQTNYVNPIWSRNMAAAVLGMLPLVTLYFVAQKYILKGISISSGLKG